MKLTLDTQQLRSSAVVRCTGRIVAGLEVQLLRERLTALGLETQSIILNLSGVSFLDSSGMGALMHLRAVTRSRGGEILLCEVPGRIEDALSLTGLVKLFRLFATEPEALAAVNTSSVQEPTRTNEDCILCVSDTADMRTFLRTVLSSARYNALTCESLYDAKIFLKTSKPKLIILGPCPPSIDVASQLKGLAPSVPIIPLDQNFSGQEAGHAGRELLARVAQVLRPAGLV